MTVHQGNYKPFPSTVQLPFTRHCMSVARLGIALLTKSGLICSLRCQIRPFAAENFGLTCRKRHEKFVNHSWHPGVQDTRRMVHVWNTGLQVSVSSADHLQDFCTLLCDLVLCISWSHAEACAKGLNTQALRTGTHVVESGS